MAQIIYNIHNELSISGILNDKSIPLQLIAEKFSNQ